MRDGRVVAQHHAGVPEANQVRQDSRPAGLQVERGLREHPRLRLLRLLHLLLFLSCEYQNFTFRKLLNLF